LPIEQEVKRTRGIASTASLKKNPNPMELIVVAAKRECQELVVGKYRSVLFNVGARAVKSQEMGPIICYRTQAPTRAFPAFASP
jgi:hypothetical protein